MFAQGNRKKSRIRQSVQPTYGSRFEAGMSDSTTRGLVALSALDTDLVRFLPLNGAAFFWYENKNYRV
jgi:hypothetical protein